MIPNFLPLFHPIRGMDMLINVDDVNAFLMGHGYANAGFYQVQVHAMKANVQGRVSLKLNT